MNTRTKQILERLSKVHEIDMTQEGLDEFCDWAWEECEIEIDLTHLSAEDAADEIAEVMSGYIIGMNGAETRNLVQRLIDVGALVRTH